MARTQGKLGLIVTIVVLVVTLILVGSIAFWKNSDKSQPKAPATSTETTPEPAKDATLTETDDADTTPPSSATQADPATLSSIDVEPLGITVFYTKGTPGFGFAVKRTADKTQYVEFSSSDLAGTKCTNDEGLFVTIIKNPTSSEDQTTISQKVTVGSDTYGLSLAGKGCTNNAELLTEYQTAFTNGFSSLKAL